ncbi:hypothetical protein GO613_19755 [Azoarcus communis]|uniref:hypothetical protein n=1 Tax=Parazoarcus communis TaxID=41977 RepID=UPI0014594CEF|nr:hypothetical protein [Parazoarcus communis]NMG50332.1 hypothetical protein [Parazoarcus communis]
MLAKKSLLHAALLAGAALPMTASAVCNNKNYGVLLSVFVSQTETVEEGTRCENTAEKFFDLLNDASFSSIVPSYNSESIASATVNFNSLPIQFDFEDSGSALRFRIAALGVDLVFEGVDRDDSSDMLVDYLKKSGILSSILKYQAENSPNSPIAGPGGMIPSAAAADFDAAMSDTLREIQGNTADSPNFSVGASWGSMDIDGKKGEVTNLPLSRVWRSTEVPGRVFTLSGSLTQVKVAGAASYHGGLGVAYRLPVSSRWSLTPSLRYAVTGSADLASVAGLYSVGVSSTYHIPLGSMDLVIGNMAGYHKTTKVSFGDYSFDPDIKTWALRNGVMLSQAVNLAGLPLAVEYSLVDTRYTGGTKFFVDNTQEIGVSVGTNRSGDLSKNYMRFGLRYLHGRDTNTVTLSGSYWF